MISLSTHPMVHCTVRPPARQFECPDFSPHPLLQGGHVQTLYAAWFPGKVSTSHRPNRHHVELPDGDSLTVHDDVPTGTWTEQSPVVLLVHGMCSSADSPHIIRVAQKLQTEGFRTFRMNLRGCGDGKGLAREPYHAGRSEDVQTVIEFIRHLCPYSPIHLVGFSLGGNIVLKWLGEHAQAASHLVTRAIAVNPPVDLHACSQALPRQAYGMYDRYFTRKLFHHIVKCPNLSRRDPWAKSSRRPRRMLEFDELFTAPQSGFESAMHYYEECSAAQFVPRITVPTLILSSHDDPLIPAGILERLALPPSVSLHIAKSGGHLGFIGRNSEDPDQWWLDWRVVDWLTHPEIILDERLAA